MKRRLMLVAVIFPLLAVLSLPGCVTVPPPAQERVFYPPPPQEPRIQFLASFSTSSDVTGRPGWFTKFVVGEPEEKPLLKPYGFDFWLDSLYVCDTLLAALVVIDFGKHELRYVTPAGAGRLSKPVNLAIDADGTKYIADAGRGEVVILDREDRYAGSLSRDGGWKPTGVAIAGDRLYVTDLQNRCVGVWDKAARRYLYSIPAAGSRRQEENLFSPVNLALDAEGNLFVSDLGASRVQKYDREGRWKRSFGSLGDSPGQFVRPKGIDLDRAGRLYVVDAASEVVQIFDAEGKLLLFFGEPRSEGAFLSLPAQVRVNTSLLPYFAPLAGPSLALEHLIFVSSQYGGHKISVFGFGTAR